MTEQQWQRWLRKSAASERCLLVELNSSDGPIYLSSRAYISRPSDALPNQPFRDCITETLEIDDEDVMAVGDFEFTWPERAAAIRNAYWRGYSYTVWMGSAAWAMDEFRVINSGFIDSVSRSSPSRIKVQLAGLGLALLRPLDAELSGSAQSVIESIVTQCGLPVPVFVNFSTDELAATVLIELPDSGIQCNVALDDVLDSFTAFIIASGDSVQIIKNRFDGAADYVITDDDIVTDGLSEINEIMPLSKISFSYLLEDSNDLVAENPVQRYPEGWIEEQSFNTVFTNQADAQRELDLLSAWRFQRRIRYYVEVLTRGADFQRGQRLGIESDLWGLSVVATILNIERRPDSNRYRLEVIA